MKACEKDAFDEFQLLLNGVSKCDHGLENISCWCAFDLLGSEVILRLALIYLVFLDFARSICLIALLCLLDWFGCSIWCRKSSWV
jgi:hypothetical protein